MNVTRRALLILAVLLGACRASVQIVPANVQIAETQARTALANERQLGAESIDPRTVGVLPLSVSAADTLLQPLGYGLAELLLTDLSRSSQLQIVDRVRTDALLRELALASDGRVDPSTAPRVGRLLGARRLMLGGLSATPDGQVRIDARIADVTTSEVALAVSAAAPLNDILDAEKALAFRLFEQLGVTLTPAERAAVEQRPTKSLGALLAYSRAVQAEAGGQYAQAAGFYQSAIAQDPSFAAAQAGAANMQSATDAGPSASSGGRGNRRAQALRRAALGASQRINPRAGFNIGGPADAAFPGLLNTTLIITVTVPVIGGVP